MYRRILEKDGHFNISIKQIPNKYKRFVKDFENTLILSRWRWILLMLILINATCWVFFAFAWMTLAWYTDDLYKSDADRDVCIIGTRSFTGYLLLSIETQTTIGFGVIYPADCLHSWIILALQGMANLLIEGILVAAVYVKMSRPKRVASCLFSKKAIITMRDGQLCLAFRVWDYSGRFWIKTHLSAHIIEYKAIPSVKKLRLVSTPECSLGPVDIVHIIDKHSALWSLTAEDFLCKRFEIIFSINGESVLTGQPSQMNKSYTNSEIQWGRRYLNCMKYNEMLSANEVDASRFDSTIMYNTPLCSAQQLDALAKDLTINQ